MTPTGRTDGLPSRPTRVAAALGDHDAARLADELAITAGNRFSDRFQAGALPARTGVERWAHPEAGELVLAYESLELPGPDERYLLVYLPADDATAAALDLLTSTLPMEVTR
ncbi:hypothetical protein C1I98_30280 [Spongiactinospora gelatinilytica]|uniref:MmyB-like transcription regulator ligand binding domain-containing protein n=1 Tax=Spongiactinospora gelatinilytica TaxID=2666298 RepID=A0A2W2FRV4_9ACTN|nr:hypothetical protein [Spongiactinospora gelatinilytica]PZG31245.1 hypothetical protein C1I98_30280 [Spongiactinospora gelatinilytica]